MVINIIILNETVILEKFIMIEFSVYSIYKFFLYSVKIIIFIVYIFKTYKTIITPNT